MLKHNFLIIVRNFKKHKSTFLINLIGLSTGLACVLLIYLWVNDELHVDKFNKNDKNLYQVMENVKQSSGIITQEATPDLLAKTLKEEVPGVKLATSVTPAVWFGNFTFSYEGRNTKAIGQFSGEDFFNIFSYDLLRGNPKEVLSNDNSVVISEALAQKMFGSVSNAIGKYLKWQILGISMEAVVSGIFKGIPENSTEQFDFVLSYDQWIKLSKIVGRTINWGNSAVSTYIVLNNNTNIKSFNKKIAPFIKERNKYSNADLFVRPYSDRYLFNKYENGVQAGGRIEYVRLFSIIALFILLIACINFMNLSTAKASTRMKEVGIKKTIGATRKTLAFQYLSESVLMAFLSFAIALIVVELILPEFNGITGKHMSLNLSENILLSFIAITLLTGVIAGSYPALYLSGFNPVSILKGKLGNNSTGELWLRKGLVIFQFTLSAILIAAVLVVYKQMEFIQSKNLGYNKDNLIYFNAEGDVPGHMDTFLSEIKNIPGVVNASSTSENVTSIISSTFDVNWPGKKPGTTANFFSVNANYNLIETLGMKMEEGRTFSKKFPSDSLGVIFNQAAINLMGLKDPLGKIVHIWGKDRHIIGVVDNFNFESLHEQVKPLFLIFNPQRTMVVTARIKAGTEKETIGRLIYFYKSFNPGFAFDYKFTDKDYQALYSSEERVSVLSRYFAGLAIIISCLGLFGLSAFTAEKRRKEIGIRKVLGASETSIIYLLSGDFSKLVLISNLIALPAAYYIMSLWLQSFAYKISLTWWMFIISGGIVFLIALITVGMQAIRAATANPVKSLRYE